MSQEVYFDLRKKNNANPEEKEQYDIASISWLGGRNEVMDKIVENIPWDNYYYVIHKDDENIKEVISQLYSYRNESLDKIKDAFKDINRYSLLAASAKAKSVAENALNRIDFYDDEWLEYLDENLSRVDRAIDLLEIILDMVRWLSEDLQIEMQWSY